MIFKKKIQHTCPRRYEIGQRQEDNRDTWLPSRFHNDGKTCSYCGSMEPDEFMRRVKEGVVLGPTDKNYKVYIRAADGKHEGKFYFQHLSVEQRKEFVELLNEKKISFSYPGSFYNLPFFITRAPKEN